MPSRSDNPPPANGHSRRSFLQISSGAAGAVAVSVVTPAAMLAIDGSAQAADAPAVPIPHPSEPLPDEVVMAYVSHAERSEVTVLSGTQQTTFHDPALVRRLLKAARSHTS